MIPIYPVNATRSDKLDAMLVDDSVNRLYRLERSVFTDAQLFELEMKYILA